MRENLQAPYHEERSNEYLEPATGILPDDTIAAVHDYANHEASYTNDPDVVDHDDLRNLTVMTDNNLGLPNYHLGADREPVDIRPRLVSDKIFPSDQLPARPDAPNMSNPWVGADFAEDLANRRVYRTRFELQGLPHAQELAQIDFQRAALDNFVNARKNKSSNNVLLESFDDLDRQDATFASLGSIDPQPEKLTRGPLLKPVKPTRKKKLAAEAAKRASAALNRCAELMLRFNAPKPKRNAEGEKETAEVLRINRSTDRRIDPKRSSMKRKAGAAAHFDPLLGVVPPMVNAPTSKPFFLTERRVRQVEQDRERSMESIRSTRRADGRRNASGNKLKIDMSADEGFRKGRPTGSMDNLSAPARNTGKLVLNGQEIELQAQQNRVYVKNDANREAEIFVSGRDIQKDEISLHPTAFKLTTDEREYQKFEIPGNHLNFN
jgi:hypothetical protein